MKNFLFLFSFLLGIIYSSFAASKTDYIFGEPPPLLCNEATSMLPKIKSIILSNNLVVSEMGNPSDEDINGGFLDCEKIFLEHNLKGKPEELGTANSLKDLIVSNNLYYIPFCLEKNKKCKAVTSFTKGVNGDFKLVSVGYAPYAKSIYEGIKRIEQIKKESEGGGDKLAFSVVSIPRGQLDLIYAIDRATNEQYLFTQSSQIEQEILGETVQKTSNQKTRPHKLDLAAVLDMLFQINEVTAEQDKYKPDDDRMEPFDPDNVDKSEKSDSFSKNNSQIKVKKDKKQVQITPYGATLPIKDIKKSDTKLTDELPNIKRKSAPSKKGNNRFLLGGIVFVLLLVVYFLVFRK